MNKNDLEHTDKQNNKNKQTNGAKIWLGFWVNMAWKFEWPCGVQRSKFDEKNDTKYDEKNAQHSNWAIVSVLIEPIN